MTTVVHPGALPGLTVNLKFIDGQVGGYRRADALGSQILVDAGPVAHFSRIAAAGTYRNRTVVYVIGGTKFYVGRGEGHKRVPMQVNALASIAEQFYLIYPRDPRIDQRVARYLEGRLIPAAFACGAHLINKLVAYPPEYCEYSQLDYERLFSEAALFLTAAGCPILNTVARNHDQPSNEIECSDGFRIIAAGDFTPPDDAILLRLNHPGLNCEGYAIGGDLIIKPGSHFVIKEGRGDLRQSNFRRHESIKSAGILEYNAEDPHRARLKAWVKFEKRGIASRVLARAHATPLLWETVEPEPERAHGTERGGDHAAAL